MVGIPLLFMLILAISVHEMAHAWMALRCGDDTAARLGRLTINPVVHFDPMGILFIMMAPFGWGKPVPYNPVNLRDIQRDSMWIAWAGPASNFIQTILLTILFWLFANEFVYQKMLAIPTGEQIYNACISVFYWGIHINLVLAFFNLLPFFPLDGEKILQGLVSREMAYKLEGYRNESMMCLFLLLGIGWFTPIKPLWAYLSATALPLKFFLIGM